VSRRARAPETLRRSAGAGELNSRAHRALLLWAVERPNHSKNGCLRGCPRAATCRFMERRPRTPSPGHINQRCARSTPYSESENDRKPEVPRFIYPLDIAKDTTLDVTVVTTRAHRATACTQHPPHPEARASMEREAPGGAAIGNVLFVLSVRYLRFSISAKSPNIANQRSRHWRDVIWRSSYHCELPSK
jgi:hypothetical protein